MNAEVTSRLQSHSRQETWEIGRRTGAALHPDAVVLLIGPLGSGKTVLAKGIADALGVKEEIVSPTYTIVAEYPGAASSGVTMYHIDLYRIEGSAQIESLALDDILWSGGISLVEWGEKLTDSFSIPPVRVTLGVEGARGALGDRRGAGVVNCLAINCSTDVLGISCRKGDTWATLSLRRGLQHSPALVPLMDRLLRELELRPADLDLIVCSVGPGSFTGIRIGLATAKGMALATGCPLVGVSTLDSFALPYAASRLTVWPVIDARKGNYYAAAFREESRVSEYMDLAPAELRGRMEDSGGGLLVGPDAEMIAERLQVSGTTGVHASSFTDPRALLEIGQRRFAERGADPTGVVPLYLRKSEAEISAERAS